MIPVRTVLVPTDFSPGSAEALQKAVALASQCQACLVLLHVLPLAEMGRVLAEIGERDRYAVDLLYREYERRLAEFYNRVVPTEVRSHLKVTTLFVPGDPAEEIVWQAVAHKAGLIVMATHGRTGLGRLLHGSVAEQVVRHAPCPVLTLRPSTATRGEAGYREAA